MASRSGKAMPAVLMTSSMNWVRTEAWLFFVFVSFRPSNCPSFASATEQTPVAVSIFKISDNYFSVNRSFLSTFLTLSLSFRFFEMAE